MEVPGKRTDVDSEEEKVENMEKFCELCEVDSVNTQASGFCKECEQYMCNTCFRQHLRAKSCRHHTLLDISAVSETCLKTHSRALECKQHAGEAVKYYCRTHEAVGCGDCMISNHMACKQPEFIKDLSANFQENEEYKTFMKKIENQISDGKTFEQKIQKSKKDNKLMLEKTLEDVKQFRLDINKYLDKVETDITQQVKNVMEENETLLKKMENDYAVFSTKLEEITHMLNNELYKDNVLFIHMVECKPKLSESETAISSMKSKPMKKYEFVRDEQLRSLVSSAQKLGTLAISSLAIYPQTSDQAKEKNKSQGNAADTTGDSERGDVKPKTVEGGIETKESGVRPVVAVGARVKSNWMPFRRGGVDYVRGFEKYVQGTVTAVHEDAMVSVKWDRGGGTGRYRIGKRYNDVTVIQS